MTCHSWITVIGAVILHLFIHLYLFREDHLEQALFCKDALSTVIQYKRIHNIDSEGTIKQVRAIHRVQENKELNEAGAIFFYACSLYFEPWMKMYMHRIICRSIE